MQDISQLPAPNTLSFDEGMALIQQLVSDLEEYSPTNLGTTTQYTAYITELLDHCDHLLSHVAADGK